MPFFDKFFFAKVWNCGVLVSGFFRTSVAISIPRYHICKVRLWLEDLLLEKTHIKVVKPTGTPYRMSYTKWKDVRHKKFTWSQFWWWFWLGLWLAAYTYMVVPGIRFKNARKKSQIPFKFGGQVNRYMNTHVNLINMLLISRSSGS